MQGRTETLKPLTAAIEFLKPLNSAPSPALVLWASKAIRGQAGGALEILCRSSFLALNAHSQRVQE